MCVVLIFLVIVVSYNCCFFKLMMVALPFWFRLPFERTTLGLPPLSILFYLYFHNYIFFKMHTHTHTTTHTYICTGRKYRLYKQMLTPRACGVCRVLQRTVHSRIPCMLLWTYGRDAHPHYPTPLCWLCVVFGSSLSPPKRESDQADSKTVNQLKGDHRTITNFSKSWFYGYFRSFVLLLLSSNPVCLELRGSTTLPV